MTNINITNEDLMYIHIRLIESKIEQHEEYFNYVQNYLEGQKIDFGKNNENNKFKEYFPNILYNSIFLSCYSLIEHYLYEVSTLSEAQKKGKINDGIDAKFSRYINRLKDIGFNFEDRTKQWQYVREYSRLRNVIIHNATQLDKLFSEKQYKQIKEFIKKNKNIHLDNSEQIILTSDFIEEVFCNIRYFLNDFNQSWKNWIESDSLKTKKISIPL